MRQSGAVRVFETQVGGSGRIEVTAAAELATRASVLQVVFMDAGSLGRHVELQTEGEVVASFPYLDHADERLAESAEPWMPLGDLNGNTWDDLDQGWYLWTHRQGDDVFVFESNFDDLLTISGVQAAKAAPDPGRVLVDGVEATWWRCDLAAFRRAWIEAQIEARRLVAEG